MKTSITKTLLDSRRAAPKAKPYEIADERQPGFVLRVQPSGARSFICRYWEDGKDRRITVGKVGEIEPDDARALVKAVLGNVAANRPALDGLVEEGPKVITLGDFLDGEYGAWLAANRPRTAKKAAAHVRSVFSDWLRRPLTAITVPEMERWKIHRLHAVKPATVMRDIAAISGVLTRAVRFGHLAENPIRRLDKPRIDRNPRPRYLDEAEEKRLREALAERDARMIAARESANGWRAARGQRRKRALPHFGDHLTPAVIVSMNTGLRLGELLAMTWDDVDLRQGNITIEGGTAKSGHTRHVPLNAEAVDMLKKWKEQSSDKVRVFPIDTGFKTSWAALLLVAKIEKFRWHDLRHHFASRLAQKGVPLNVIRELLGHGSLTMALRYAHLAPDQRREAVDLLTEGNAA